MRYAYFILTEYAAVEVYQNDDVMSCVTGFTGTTGTTFYAQDRRIDLTKKFGHAVDKAQIESKKKQTVAASRHQQYYMGANKNQPSDR